VIRAVLDTNTIVSGVGWGGSPGAVLDAALAGRFEMVTSPSLLDELRRVLSYPKLQAVNGGADELTELLALATVVINPTETVAVSRDPDDDRLIEAAWRRTPTSSSPATKICSPWEALTRSGF